MYHKLLSSKEMKLALVAAPSWQEHCCEFSYRDLMYLTVWEPESVRVGLILKFVQNRSICLESTLLIVEQRLVVSLSQLLAHEVEFA